MSGSATPVPTIIDFVTFILPHAPPMVVVMVAGPLKLLRRMAAPVEELMERPEGLEENQDTGVFGIRFCNEKVPEEQNGLAPVITADELQ